MERIKPYLILLALSLLLGPTQSLLASSPYLTGNPVPEDYRHTDLTLFSSINKTPEAIGVLAPALIIEYGLFPNVEVSTTIPVASFISLNNESPSAVGLGDVQLGVNYRFIQETKNFPQIAFNPTYYLSTGNLNRNLGNGKGWTSLPFWAQKSWDSWTLCGGGGYAMNAQIEMKNYFFGGLLVERNLTEKLSLGGEVFSQGATSITSASTTIVNFGGTYLLSKQSSFLFSVGHSVLGANNLVAYLGVDWAW